MGTTRQFRKMRGEMMQIYFTKNYNYNSNETETKIKVSYAVF